MIAFDRAPLQGRTILVTRAAHQAQSTLDGVERRGGSALLLPCLEVEFYPEAVSQALQALQQDCAADLLVTSRNGLDSLLSQCSALDLQQWIGNQRRVIAVGKRSAEALQQIGVEGVITPAQFSQQGVGTWWDQHGWPQRLFFVRAAQGRDDLFSLLEQRGCVTTLLVCYGSRTPPHVAPVAIVQQLEAGDVDAILIGSSATARGLVARVGLGVARHSIVVAISQRVADESTQLGLCVQVVAAQASFDTMLDQLGDYFGGT